MKRIPLTQGMFAIVDDKDYARLAQYNWSAEHHQGRTYYAKRALPGSRKLKRFRRMHVDVMGHQPGRQLDHRNLNGLDNRRRNLRWATPSLNMANQRGRAQCGYKGVSAQTRGRGFRARVTVNYQEIHLGTFATPKLAAQAYNQAAVNYFGEFARLNQL